VEETEAAAAEDVGKPSKFPEEDDALAVARSGAAGGMIGTNEDCENGWCCCVTEKTELAGREETAADGKREFSAGVAEDDNEAGLDDERRFKT